MSKKSAFREIGRGAFTLIEVLISIALLSIVLLALYNSLGLLRDSNLQLFKHLQKAALEKKATETLFLDIAGSNGEFTIEGEEFAQLCINETSNSLYGLNSAKVCWIVSKKDNQLMRSEGNDYKLPLITDNRVAVDVAMSNIDLFRAYRKKSEVLVLLRQKGKESISFMVHGVPEIAKTKTKKTIQLPSGVKPSVTLPSGQPPNIPVKLPPLS